MGIHGFYSHFIKQKYPASVVTNYDFNNKVYGLYIDLNGLLHRVKFIVFGGPNAARKYGKDIPDALRQELVDEGIELDENSEKRALRASKQSEEQLLETYKKVFSILLVTIVTAYSPNVELGLYVDGVVPSAKTQQQRQRREKSAKDRTKDTKFNIFDNTNITPGTPFMFWVDDMIRDWIKRHINHEFVPQRIIYSNHLVEGEGEHKIMDHLRKLRYEFEVEAEKKNLGLHNEYNYVVYGLDADLIVLSLLQKMEGIILTRENTSDNVDIDDLRERIKTELDIGTGTEIQDFSVMMSFIGNDFLPMIMSADMVYDLNAMFSIYKKKRLALTVNEGVAAKSKHPYVERWTIDWDNLLEFLKGLAAYEQVRKYQKLAKEEVERNNGNRTDSLLSRSYMRVKSKEERQGLKFIYDKYRTLWYQHVFKNYGDRDLAEEYTFDNNDILDDKGEIKEEVVSEIDDMCYEYLKGLEWVLRYYTRGHDHVSHTWFYPYHYAPLYLDMYEVLKEDEDFSIKVGYKKDGGYTVLHQLFSVTPRASMNLLPPQLHKLVKGTASNITYLDMFPNNVVIDREGSHLDHISVALTPFIDRLRVQEAIQSVIKDFTDMELARYLSEDEVVFKTKRVVKLDKLYRKIINEKSKNKNEIKTKEKKTKEKNGEKEITEDKNKSKNKRKHPLELFDFANSEYIM